MYADVNTAQPHTTENPIGSSTAPESPQIQGSHKRKRDSVDDNTPAEDSVQERRASLKRNALAQNNNSFMAVNQATDQVNTGLAFTPITQSSAPVNGAGSDQSAVMASQIPGLVPQMQAPQAPMGFGPTDGTIRTTGQLDPSFNAISPPPPPPQMQQDQRQITPSGNATGAHAPGTPSNPKPQVGTEEWHKVRRDNHKEGMYF